MSDEKLMVDLDKPGSEEGQLAPPSDDVAGWLNEEVDVFDMAAEMLKEEGVSTIFGLTAGGCWNIEGHCLKAGIERVHVRTEETATFAADAYGRMSRRPGIAVSGPATGICYATAGVAQGFSAQSPMVYIAGESGWQDDDKFQLQGLVRAERMCESIAKSARRVPGAATFLFQLKRALRSAVTPPTGPCVVAYTYEYLDRSESIGPRINYLVHYTPGTWAPKPRRSVPPPEDVKKFMEWLIDSERPSIVTGEGVAYDDAQDELREFVALTGIPCHTRRNSRGAISEYDPLNCYGRARGYVMRKCDKGVLMGLRCGGLEWFGYPPFFGDQATYTQIQTHPDNTVMAIPTAHELIGDMKLTLKLMTECARDMGITKPPEKWDAWRHEVATKKEEYHKRTIERTDKQRGVEPLHPDILGRITAEFLHEELDDEYYSIIDGFTAATYYSDWIKVKDQFRILDASDTIGFGHAPGMALGCNAVTKGDRPIIAVMGDGAMGACGMDIETCYRWDVPCVFIHHNNNQIVGGGHFFWKDIWPSGNREKDGWFTGKHIRYDKMIAEFGCHTELVTKDSEARPALKRAFDFVRDKSKPAFIECFVDEDVMQEIWPTICATWSSGWIPFKELPKEAQELMHKWKNHVAGATKIAGRADWWEALDW